MYRPVDMAFLKEGRSDSVRSSFGGLFQIFGAKNKNEFVPCLTLFKKVFLGLLNIEPMEAEVLEQECQNMTL